MHAGERLGVCDELCGKQVFKLMYIVPNNICMQLGFG